MPRERTTSTLVQRLENALVVRDVLGGIALMDSTLGQCGSFDINSPDAISLLLIIAQWNDLGYRDIGFFDGFLVDIPSLNLAELPLLDFLKLRMVESFRCLAGEHLEEAIATFDLVLRAGKNVLPEHLVFLANFWKGRAHRKRGDYEQAGLHITAARATAEKSNAPRLVAVAKIHESWLAFQKGEGRYAFQLLDEAEEELRPTGHGLSLGNIESARGRFVRRSGEYARALGHFEAAIAIYAASCPNHPNLARALVNAAYVKRLIALDLQPRKSGGHAVGATHERYLRISKEALELLRQAGEIYGQHHHQGGTGSVLVNAAHLHLESGDIDRASTEAQRAFALGEENRDQILMARAKIAQAAVELARAEEQVGDVPDIALHANSAVRNVEEAIELALQTQNNRLIAEAYIVRGLAAADDYFQDWELAKECAAKGAALLGNDRDHLYKVLGDLKSKILGSVGIDETLRLWSAGQLGNKTFQQIQEEFAELVIPKVWINTGRNVTLVSQKLSISPKKVRRILRNAKQSDAP